MWFIIFQEAVRTIHHWLFMHRKEITQRKVTYWKKTCNISYRNCVLHNSITSWMFLKGNVVRMYYKHFSPGKLPTFTWRTYMISRNISSYTSRNPVNKLYFLLKYIFPFFLCPLNQYAIISSHQLMRFSKVPLLCNRPYIPVTTRSQLHFKSFCVIYIK